MYTRKHTGADRLIRLRYLAAEEAILTAEGALRSPAWERTDDGKKILGEKSQLQGEGILLSQRSCFLKLYRPGNLGKIPILSHIFEMGWGFTNNIPIADGKVKMYFGFSAKMLMRSSNLVGEHPRAFVGTASRRTSGK